MIIYDELISKMSENNITSFTIKKGKAKENLINQYTYSRMKNNAGSIGLDILEKLLKEMDIDEVKLIRDGDDYKITFPTERQYSPNTQE